MQEGRLAAAQTELNNAQNQLDEKQMELDQVQAMYDAAMKEKQALLDDAEACRRKMNNATALIEGLGGEKVLAHYEYSSSTELVFRFENNPYQSLAVLKKFKAK